MTMTHMQKITRIGDILNGTEVERDNSAAELEWFHELWARASTIELRPEDIPTGWIISAFDDARREAELPAGQPMDPMTAGDWTPLCTLPSRVLSLGVFDDLLLAVCEGGTFGVNPDGSFYPITPHG